MGDEDSGKVLANAWATRDTATAAAGEHSRKLCYIGFALVAVFGGINSGEVSFPVDLPSDLLWAGILLGASLACDLLQYCYMSVAWSVWPRVHERAGSAPTHFPAWINWPTNVLFWSKLILAAVGWGLLLWRMADSFT